MIEIKTYEGEKDIFNMFERALKVSCYADVNYPIKVDKIENAKKIFLAKENKEIVGAILIASNEKGLYIDLVAVLPEFRKQGISEKLIRKAEEYLKEQGEKVSKIQILATCHKLITYYQKLGYKLHFVDYHVEVPKGQKPKRESALEKKDLNEYKTQDAYNDLTWSEMNSFDQISFVQPWLHFVKPLK